jgi:hypothetical protein
MPTTQDPMRGEVLSSVGRRGLPWWVWTAIVLFLALVLLWVASILMLPGLQTAAIQGNESAAIGYIRNVAGAQAMAASMNRGFYLPVSCLTAPSACPPAVSEEPLLSGSLTDAYSMFFQVVEAASAEEIAAKGANPRSVKVWAMVVMPREPGVSGKRTFCVDTKGDYFFTADANTLPDISRGFCNGAYPLK